MNDYEEAKSAFLDIKKQPPRILNHIFDSSEEKHSLSSIDEPMVIGEGDVHHGSCYYVASNHHWFAHN